MLAVRAATDPEEPWLFWHSLRGWSWLSFAQVADRVARGVEKIRQRVLESSAPAGGERMALASSVLTSVAFDGRCDPDQIAADLIAQASANLALAVDGACTLCRALGRHGTLWLDSPRAPSPEWVEIPTVRLPKAHSRLAAWHPARLDLEGGAGSVLTLTCKRLWRRTSQAELLAACLRLDVSLPPLPDRPIAFSYQALQRLDSRVLQAWTLLRGAAWAVERQADASLSALLWTRPHLAWVDQADLVALVAAFDDRRVRRRSRLRVLVVAEAEEGDRALESRWSEYRRRLGCEILRFQTESNHAPIDAVGSPRLASG